MGGGNAKQVQHVYSFVTGVGIMPAAKTFIRRVIGNAMVEVSLLPGWKSNESILLRAR